MANPTDDLSAGDSTPKVPKASIKDVTLAVNRISYAIKTPDDLVAPDAIQVASDGNFSMGAAPLAYATYGRCLYIYNGSNAGNASDSAQMLLKSVNNSATVSVQPGGTTSQGGFQIRRPDNIVAAALRYRLDEAALKIDMYNAATTSSSVVARFNPTGEFVVGDTTSILGKVMVLGGTATTGSQTVLYLQSSALATPALIAGADGGTVQISGGSAAAAGNRGGQIDLISGGAASNAGKIIFRGGTTANGQSAGEVGRFTPNGRFSVGLGFDADPQATIHARSPNSTRGRVLIEGLNDYAGFTGRRINGSYTTTSAVLTNDALVYFNAHGSTGNGTFAAGPALQAFATEDWTASKLGSSWSLQTIANGTTSAVMSQYWAHNGYVGINNSNPQTRLVVSHQDGGPSFEVDTAAANHSLRSYNRSTNVYMTMSYLASNHNWYVGAATNVQAMTLGANGALGINTTNISGGSGNTAMVSRVVIAESAAATALTIAGGAEYAGLKFKISALHASSGGANYYDMTVRPADASNGVAGQADKTLIRFEASSSMSPRLLLQPEGGTQQVIVGAGVTTGNTKFIIEAEAGWEAPHLLTVGKTVTVGTNPNADIVLRRAGAVASTAGKMPWIQFESTDAAFAGNGSGAIGSAANAVQIWSYVSNAWALKLDIAGSTGTTTSNNSFLINGQSNQALTVRAPAASSGNIVLQANQSFGVAYWMTTKADGSFHIGGNGASEPTMGVLSFASNSQAVGLFAGNIAMLGNTYSHGGTTRILSIYNPDTTLNAQSHIFLGTGNTTQANSAIGGISYVLPGIGSNGTARVANMGAATDPTHTAALPAGMINLATKPGGGSTAIPRVVIRASGNIVFGNVFTNDTARLYIYNEGRNVDGLRVDMSDVSNNASSMVTMRADTAGYAFSFLCGGNIAGAITHPSLTTTQYGTGSDRRIKKNIVDAPSGGNLIDQMRVVSHDFVADDYHVPYSFVAQELHSVYPNAVSAGDDAMDVGPDSKIWQVDNSKLVPLLVKEVQELRADRDVMRGELAELRELVELLRQERTK